mgnify:CR=1 FL=1
MIWAFIGGLRGLLMSIAGGALAWGALTLWHAVVVHPSIVREARAGFVAVAQLEAAQEVIRAQQAIAAHEKMRADRLAAANEGFQRSLADVAAQNEDLLHDIAELENAPAPDNCRVAPDLLKRLRSR